MRRTPNWKKEDNWKLKKVFAYFKENPFDVTGLRDLTNAVEQLEKHDWNVKKALEDAKWFSKYASRKTNSKKSKGLSNEPR